MGGGVVAFLKAFLWAISSMACIMALPRVDASGSYNHDIKIRTLSAFASMAVQSKSPGYQRHGLGLSCFQVTVATTLCCQLLFRLRK